MYHLISDEGKAVEFNSIRKFCREHNLDSSAISRVCNGTRTKHKGWRAVDNLASTDVNSTKVVNVRDTGCIESLRQRGWCVEALIFVKSTTTDGSE